MISIRPAEQRGQTRLNWLDSRHTFSFGHYYDAAFMGFRALRVINDDWIAPSGGFPMHGHRDMEVISYMLEGALRHQDTTGAETVTQVGEIQHMCAGTGIRHSEFNNSDSQSAHLLQIWIEPIREGLTPSYEQRPVPLLKEQNQWRLMASPDGRQGSITVHQDVTIHSATLTATNSIRYDLAPGRYGWLQVTRGDVEINGQALKEGDGAAIQGETALVLNTTGTTQGEVLLFDLS